MHKLEIRFSSTDEMREFEVYTEKIVDGRYVPVGGEPLMEVMNSESTPMVKMLEGDERVIIVAKTKKYRYVYDKDQNANIRVEEPDTVRDPEDVKLGFHQEKAKEAEVRIDTEITPATTPGPIGTKEAPSTAKPPAAPNQTSTGSTAAKPISPGGPSSTNVQGAVDSQQVKK